MQIIAFSHFFLFFSFFREIEVLYLIPKIVITIFKFVNQIAGLKWQAHVYSSILTKENVLEELNTCDINMKINLFGFTLNLYSFMLRFLFVYVTAT